MLDRIFPYLESILSFPPPPSIYISINMHEADLFIYLSLIIYPLIYLVISHPFSFISMFLRPACPLIAFELYTDFPFTCWSIDFVYWSFCQPIDESTWFVDWFSFSLFFLMSPSPYCLELCRIKYHHLKYLNFAFKPIIYCRFIKREFLQ